MIELNYNIVTNNIYQILYLNNLTVGFHPTDRKVRTNLSSIINSTSL